MDSLYKMIFNGVEQGVVFIYVLGLEGELAELVVGLVLDELEDVVVKQFLILKIKYMIIY